MIKIRGTNRRTYSPKLYQTSWRGTGRCDAWVVPNMGVGMQFIDTQSGK